MSELMPYNGGGALSRDIRKASRAISRGRTMTHVRMARVDNETETTIAKADALTAATGSAMTSVVRVAQAQRQLEQLAPESAGRLAYLADGHALALGDLMQDLRHVLRGL